MRKRMTRRRRPSRVCFFRPSWAREIDVSRMSVQVAYGNASGDGARPLFLGGGTRLWLAWFPVLDRMENKRNDPFWLFASVA